jgi:hypothetical protein
MIPRLDIIIVNWNAGDLLLNCVTSIKNALDDSFVLNRMVVIDNASDDASIESMINVNLPVEVIRNSINVGFAKACNQGAKGSDTDFLLFLNPDTRLFPDSLSIPISFMMEKGNERIGIIGVKQISEENIVNRNCARFPTPFKMIYFSFGLDKILPRFFPGHFMKEWDHLDSRFVDQVMGSFFMIRRNLFDELNGYDERFFVYFEDLDLALRAKKLGFGNYYLAAAKIFHKGGGTTESVKAKRLAYILHSKLLFCRKHFSLMAYYSIFITTIVIEPFFRIIDSLAKGSPGDTKEILKGYRLLMKRLISQ